MYTYVYTGTKRFPVRFINVFFSLFLLFAFPRCFIFRDFRSILWYLFLWIRKVYYLPNTRPPFCKKRPNMSGTLNFYVISKLVNFSRSFISSFLKLNLVLTRLPVTRVHYSLSLSLSLSLRCNWQWCWEVATGIRLSHYQIIFTSVELQR